MKLNLQSLTKTSCHVYCNSTEPYIISSKSQSPVTAILFASPFSPAKLGICNILVEKTRELAKDLTVKFVHAKGFKYVTLGIESSSIKPIVDKRSELFSANHITP